MVLLNTADAMFLGRDPHVPDTWRSHFGYGYEQPLVVGQHISLPADAQAGGLAGIIPWWPAPNGQIVRLEVDIDLTSGWARSTQAFTSSGVDARTPGQHTIVHEWVADHQWAGVEVGPGTEVDVLEVRRYMDGVPVGWWPGDIEVLEVYRGTVKVWPWVAPKPPAITGTYGAVGGTSSVTVSWASQPQATAGYIVYRDGVQVALLPPGTNSWTNTGLTPNTQYTYRVAGVSESGVGPPGNQVSVRTAAIPIPTLSLTPSSTSVEVYFTTVTFTLAVTANRGEGSYMLQRQLPNQGWADLAAMPSGPDAPIAIPNAIPGGTPSGYVNFRVLYTGSGAQAGISAYSPSVAVYGSYRARPGEAFFGGYEGVSPHWADINDPGVFMIGWTSWAQRVEFNVPPALGALIASMTFEVADSQGMSCTGDKNNPYIGWWTATVPPEQQGGGPRGPVAMYDSGAGWWYANNVLQDFSPFAWRLQGQVTCPNPVWGIGINTLIDPKVKVTWIDGAPPATIWGIAGFMGAPTISFG